MLGSVQLGDPEVTSAVVGPSSHPFSSQTHDGNGQPLDVNNDLTQRELSEPVKVSSQDKGEIVLNHCDPQKHSVLSRLSAEEGEYHYQPRRGSISRNLHSSALTRNPSAASGHTVTFGLGKPSSVIGQNVILSPRVSQIHSLPNGEKESQSAVGNPSNAPGHTATSGLGKQSNVIGQNIILSPRVSQVHNLPNGEKESQSSVKNLSNAPGHRVTSGLRKSSSVISQNIILPPIVNHTHNLSIDSKESEYSSVKLPRASSQHLDSSRLGVESSHNCTGVEQRLKKPSANKMRDMVFFDGLHVNVRNTGRRWSVRRDFSTQSIHPPYSTHSLTPVVEEKSRTVCHKGSDLDEQKTTVAGLPMAPVKSHDKQLSQESLTESGREAQSSVRLPKDFSHHLDSPRLAQKSSVKLLGDFSQHRDSSRPDDESFNSPTGMGQRLTKPSGKKTRDKESSDSFGANIRNTGRRWSARPEFSTHSIHSLYSTHSLTPMGELKSQTICKMRLDDAQRTTVTESQPTPVECHDKQPSRDFLADNPNNNVMDQRSTGSFFLHHHPPLSSPSDRSTLVCYYFSLLSFMLQLDFCSALQNLHFSMFATFIWCSLSCTT